MATINGSSPTRRTSSEIAAIKSDIVAILNDYHPMTVRQVYYQLVSRGVIAKTEGEYKSTVVRLLGLMRRASEIPFGFIADETRWQRKPDTYNSLEAALVRTAQTYRRAVWHDLPHRVEVWLEKEALAGVLNDETATWDVPLMVCRGYPSLSYLYGAAESITYYRKPTYLYYFGDYDPSGLDIAKKVESGIREFAPNAEVHFERVAVTKEQIDMLSLPTRPTKRTDSRSKGFQGESVEVDAIPPAQLQTLVRGCIERHINADDLDRIVMIETAERQFLWDMLRTLDGDAA